MSVPANESTRRAKPLEGLRVVECGVWHAGPGGTAILGELGADVIHVEAHGGDPERMFRSLGVVDFGKATSTKKNWSQLYELSNRGKRGLCIDLKSAEGIAVLHRLSREADVLATNLRPGERARLGLDYAALSAANPRLIYAVCSAFGPRGAYRNVGGFDIMGQAFSGMTFMLGDAEPHILQIIILDQIASITYSHAILAALLARKRTGRGQEIETSLVSAGIWAQYTSLMTAAATKKAPQRWDRMKNSPLNNTLKCKDDAWIIGTNRPEDECWPRFCEVVGQRQWVSDPRFATERARLDNARALNVLCDEVLAKRSRDEVLEAFATAGLRYVPVLNSFTQVLGSDQLLANGLLFDWDHAGLGVYRVPGYPVRFSESDVNRSVPAPDQGQHTEAVLADYGFGAEEISALRTKRIALTSRDVEELGLGKFGIM